MGDATPSKSSIKNDDEDDDDDDTEKDGHESITIANDVKVSENDKTGTSESVQTAEVSSRTAEESNNSDNNSASTLRRISEGPYFYKKKRRPVFLTFRSNQRPRQPFMNQAPNQNTSQPPRPPPYYTAQVTPEQHHPVIIRTTSEAEQQQRDQPETTEPQTAQPQTTQPQTTQPRPSQYVVSSSMPQYHEVGLSAISNPFFFNYSYWAPYPDNVPPNVLPCLAHLYKADSLFIIQQINIFDLMFMGYFDVPNFYLIQNKEGKVIYYVYETTTQCVASCCGSTRGFQLHVMDMYNNEIIYINRPCGCTGYPCCYPVMEIYSPPLVPVGAVMQVYNPLKSEFAVIDADENLIFKIYGPLCFNCCCCCLEVDFTIHAIDRQETEVGVIRREWAGFVRTFLAETDMYGITFPVDLDVRIKAVFLGVLFFIEYLYFEDS